MISQAARGVANIPYYATYAADGAYRGFRAHNNFDRLIYGLGTLDGAGQVANGALVVEGFHRAGQAPVTASPTFGTPGAGGITTVFGGAVPTPKKWVFRNLSPEDTPLSSAEVNRQLVRLEERGGKWVEVSGKGVRTARGQYNFVQQDGKTWASPVNSRMGSRDLGHVDLAGGGVVDYAGQVRFTNSGQLKIWDNGSGHYKPEPGLSRQAPFTQASFKPRVTEGSQKGIPVYEK